MTPVPRSTEKTGCCVCGYEAARRPRGCTHKNDTSTVRAATVTTETTPKSTRSFDDDWLSRCVVNCDIGQVLKFSVSKLQRERNPRRI